MSTMDHLIQFACENYIIAQVMLAVCVLLAGINMPISLDVTLITAGAFSSICPEVSPRLFFICLFFAALVSAWEAYWIGRLLGPKLYKIRLFNHLLNPQKVEKLHYYYEKFGFLTFLVGRFIPGGVRNALFMTSGLGKMPFNIFILRDIPACFISVGLVYYLGHIFGENYQTIVHCFKRYNLAVMITVFSLGGLYFLMLYLKKKRGKI